MFTLDGNLAVIQREFYIMDDLRVNVLFGVDILKPEGFIIDFSNGIVIIGACEKVRIEIYVVVDSKRVSIKAYNKNKIRLLVKSTAKIVICGLKRRTFKLLKDRDFFFEPVK